MDDNTATDPTVVTSPPALPPWFPWRRGNFTPVTSGQATDVVTVEQDSTPPVIQLTATSEQGARVFIERKEGGTRQQSGRTPAGRGFCFGEPPLCESLHWIIQ